MFEAGDFPAAVKQLSAAAELNPRLPQLQSLYGRALLNTGDPDAAEEAFRKELAGNPNDYAANLGLGQILVARKQFQEAMPPLRHALLIRAQSADAQAALASALAGAGKFQEAQSYAEGAVKSMPGSAGAHRTLATVYSGLHLTSRATAELHQAQALERASDAGPMIGEIAPDFELADPVTGKHVRLRDYRGKAVALVFGSYSCPNFRASADTLKKMEKAFGANVSFLLVYIREAHASDNWQSTRNLREGVSLAPATTLAEKGEHAVMCSRELHLPFPAVVDGMDGAVEAAYNAWPSRAFLIGGDGRVRFSTRLSELDFHPDEMEAALRGLTVR